MTAVRTRRLYRAEWKWVAATQRVVVWLLPQTAKGKDRKGAFVPRVILPGRYVADTRDLNGLETVYGWGILWLRQHHVLAFNELRDVYPVLRDWVLDKMGVQ